MSSNSVLNASDNENACVVCFKIVEIYSIGDCDHPVCYECSTRMRVLCRQNECPICRQDMPKVIFTKNALPYKKLQNSTNLFDRKYRICFMDSEIQTFFNELLEHNCHKCLEENRSGRFKTFNQLKEHMRREHELHYCDLCVENLKIFSYERRSYTRSELAQHRRKGDPDDKSHKGHPLCEFCDTRYMDSDELFRHLRRDHLYCHFCDADGYHHYYSSYEFLRQHFRNEHFLCEEGDCLGMEFTSVFRTEIDLKAHRASSHGRSIGKAATKQARTLELEFTLAPRSRVEHNTRPPQRRPQNGKNPSREDSFRNEEGAVGFDSGQNDPGPNNVTNNIVSNNSTKLTVDPMNSQDFPSLTSNNSSAISRPTSSLRNAKPSTSALARTKENFPALGPPETATSSAHVRLSVQGPSNAVIRNNTINPNVSIHVSNRANGSVTIPNKAPNIRTNNREDDFPSLEPVNYKLQGLASKHRSLISDGYTSLSSSVAAPKVSLIKKEQRPASFAQGDVVRKTPIGGGDDFPSLGNNSQPHSSPQWLISKPKKQSKVAPAPVLPKSHNFNDSNAFPVLNKTDNSKPSMVKTMSQPITAPAISNWGQTSESKVTKNKKKKGSTNDLSKKENVDKSKISEKNSTPMMIDSGKGKKEKKKERKRSELTIDSLNSSENSRKNEKSSANSINVSKCQLIQNEQANCVPVPPGFSEVQATPPGFGANPPPGFASQEANGLTFISSSGQTYNILPGVYSYTQPNGFSHRNKVLVERFQRALSSPSSMAEFLEASKLFREGILSSEIFYEHCKEALGEDFGIIFPELLALLPDISKQQELYFIFQQNESSSARKIDMCATCHQVLLNSDLKNHVLTHSLENHFPVLGNEVPIQNVWKK